MSDSHPDGISEIEAAELVEEEFQEYLREMAVERRDRLEERGDQPDPPRKKRQEAA